MDFEFLSPVADFLIAHNQLLPKQSFGATVGIHTERYGIPSTENVKIALIGINEHRSADVRWRQSADLSRVRYHLYRLFAGNWSSKAVDLGNINAGATLEDTYFAVKTLSARLIDQDVIPVFFGGGQDLTFPLYRAYDDSAQMVNIVSVDSKFDFGDAEQLISSHSYMSKIIMEKPNNLNHYTNLGFQTFFNAQEEIDLMERLFFDAFRLGEVTRDPKIAEPVMRSADLVSFDLSSVRASDAGMAKGLSPTGFGGMELCALARYAGISDRVSSVGFFEFQDNETYAQLLAQTLWYFIEGVNFRLDEYPRRSVEGYTKYSVLVDYQELTFYKSPKSQRWWVQAPLIAASNNNSRTSALLPCTHQDYLDACNNQMPQRWWKAYRKAMS